MSAKKEEDEDTDEIEDSDEIAEVLMYHVVFKGGAMLRVELPINEVPSSREELVLARNISPITYWTGAILDWNDISACVPDYSNI